MTEMIKKHVAVVFVGGFVAGVLAIAVLAFQLGRAPESSPYEIVLVARDVSFRLAEQPDVPNPTLRFASGRPVRLVLRNEEPGKVLHCFTAAGLGVRSSRHLAAGESEVFTFTPRRRGSFAYACLMHPGMTGRVVVE